MFKNLPSVCGVLVGAMLTSGVAYAQTNRDVPANFPTIQAAINAADPGDVVRVSAGTYNLSSTLVINKSLTLQGPGGAFNINQTSPDANQAVLTGKGIRINDNVSDVTITRFFFDGIQDDNIHIGQPNGIEGVNDNISIQRNHFTGGGAAIKASSDDVTRRLNIGLNAIFDLTKVNASGVFLIKVEGLTMRDNIIRNTQFAGLILNNVQGFAGFNNGNVAVGRNTITNIPQEGVQVAGASKEVQISNNTIKNANMSATVGKGGVVLLNANELTGRARVQRNHIEDSFNGISVSGDVQGQDILLSGNTFTGNSNAGVFYEGPGQVNARRNFWGAANGPSGRWFGSGDPVLSRPNVAFCPFLDQKEGSPVSCDSICRTQLYGEQNNPNYPFAPGGGAYRPGPTVDITPTSARLTWNETLLPNETAFRVRLAKLSNRNNDTPDVRFFTTTDSFVEVSNLFPGEEYTYNVTILCGDQAGNNGGGTFFNTLSGQVAGFVIGDQDNCNRHTITFGKVPGANDYEYRIQVDGTTSWRATRVGNPTGDDQITQTDSTITVILGTPIGPNTTYNFEVRTNFGQGRRSAWASTTFLTSGMPEAPTHLQTGPIADVAAILSWEAVACATSYEYRIQRTGTTSWRQARTDDANNSNVLSPTSVKADRLLANTCYTWQVRAKYPGGITSDWSEANFCTTGPVTCDIVQECATASEVIFVRQGKRKNGSNVPANRSNPGKMLGEPESNDTFNFFSLGFGGEAILRLSSPIVDQPGDDLRVVETSFGRVTSRSYPERAQVSVSQNGIDFVVVGVASVKETLFDLSGTGLNCINFVRFVDISDPARFNNTADGFDVDGISCVQLPPAPVDPFCTNEVATQAGPADDSKMPGRLTAIGTYLEAGNPADKRWRIRNNATETVTYTWEQVDGAGAGSFTIPAKTELFFSTASANTMILRVAGNQVDVKAHGGTTKNLADCNGTPCTPEVTGFTLVNADSDGDIGPLTDGGVIDLDGLPTQSLNIRAEFTCDRTESVQFTLTLGGQPVTLNTLGLPVSQNLSNPQDANVWTEQFAPYALFQDNGGNYLGRQLAPGSYTLTATAYDEDSARGTAGLAKVINFTVVGGSGSGGGAVAHVEVYPVPTMGQLFVQVADAAGAQLRLVDMVGRTHVVPTTVRGGELQIDLRQLPAGRYVLQVQTADGMATKSVIKQ